MNQVQERYLTLTFLFTIVGTCRRDTSSVQLINLSIIMIRAKFRLLHLIISQEFIDYQLESPKTCKCNCFMSTVISCPCRNSWYSTTLLDLRHFKVKQNGKISSSEVTNTMSALAPAAPRCATLSKYTFQGGCILIDHRLAPKIGGTTLLFSRLGLLLI